MKFHTPTFPIKLVMLAACVFLPICPLTAIADNALPASENAIRVSNDKDTLSAQITDADISDVAQMLSEAAGIRVLLDQSITQTIKSGFQDVPIETGIKKLFGPNLNTALIFVKEENASGETAYRLDTLRIFNRGDQSSADFKEFRQAVSEESHSEQRPDPPSRERASDSRQQPQTLAPPWSERRRAMLAEAHGAITRRKNKIRAADTSMEIARLRMKMSQNLSPEERVELARQLSLAQQEIARMQNPNAKAEATAQSLRKHPSGRNSGIPPIK